MFNQSLEYLTAYASPSSRGRVSIFDGTTPISEETVREFLSTPNDKRMAVDWLHERGFEVERIGPLSIRLSGSASLFENTLGVAFEPHGQAQWLDVLSQKVSPLWAPSYETAMNLMDTDIPGVEGIVFPEPLSLHVESADPPALPYYHLRVPEDIIRILNAAPVHSEGVLGQGVRAAMIDSGFYWSHPYFRSKQYNVVVALPAGSDQDEVGHGTGESANLLAIAPEVELFGVSMAGVIDAIQVARDNLRVGLISCSWGTGLPSDGPQGFWTPFYVLLLAEIALCVDEGIIMVFSAGNGGMSFTASMPETISVGGVYVNEQGERIASDFASSFRSTRYPDQKVPEVCGLSGVDPRAIYIALPVPADSVVDRQYGGASFPDKDDTALDDGWAVFSGTSAACPQVAGAVALIQSKYPGADLDEIRQRLHRCQDVIHGQSAMGDQAGIGNDDATGHGLVDVEAACE